MEEVLVHLYTEKVWYDVYSSVGVYGTWNMNRIKNNKLQPESDAE